MSDGRVRVLRTLSFVAALCLVGAVSICLPRLTVAGCFAIGWLAALVDQDLRDRVKEERS